MKKVSAIMSVYNEELLLPLVLKNVEQYVDEIVIVDGSPDGVSTDNTKKVAREFQKVQYQSGTFRRLDGAWDMALQRNTGIGMATGDVLLFLSADMFFSNMQALREAIDKDKHKIFFTPTIEFWLDITNVRLYGAAPDVLTVSSPILEAVALDSSLHPYAEDSGSFNLDGAATNQRVIIPQTVKYHLGWIRPYKEQVAKHIRHIRQHRWGEEGEKLLRGGQRTLDQWAMLHVLSYPETASIKFSGELPAELESLSKMRYDDGAKDAAADFERKYGISIFKQQVRENEKV